MADSGLRKKLGLFWQLLILPALYIPYYILNDMVIVRWLGCSCPTVGPDGEVLYRAFNANDFTLLFWSLAGIAVLAVSIYKARRISGIFWKILYITVIGGCIVFMIIGFCHSMQWK